MRAIRVLFALSTLAHYHLSHARPRNVEQLVLKLEDTIGMNASMPSPSSAHALARHRSLEQQQFNYVKQGGTVSDCTKLEDKLYNLNVVDLMEGRVPEGTPIGPYFCPDTGKEVFVIFKPLCDDIDCGYFETTSGMTHLGREEFKWQFNQFDEVVYKALELLMMRRSHNENADQEESFEQTRLDPVRFARWLSGVVNDGGEQGTLQRGILVGKWTGEYADGTKPWQWTSSGAILRQFVDSNGEAVKYGQCWVFACLLTTLARAVGIPARPVTALNSGHDTGKGERLFDHAIDTYWGDTDVTTDSIWNFHVWTEVWLQRNGMEPGWNVVDGTPQELSLNSNLFECGPAAVQDVYQTVSTSNNAEAPAGEEHKEYDTDFIIGMVASMEKIWMPKWKTPDCTHECEDYKLSQGYSGPCKHPVMDFCLYEVRCNQVGTKVLTTTANGTVTIDVVGKYKPPGLVGEDCVPRNIEEEGSLAPEKNKYVHLEITHRPASVTKIGKFLRVTLNMTLLPAVESKQINVAFLVKAKSVMYSHLDERLIKAFKPGAIRLHPSRKSHTLSFELTPEDYIPFLEFSPEIQYEVMMHAYDASEGLDKLLMQVGGLEPDEEPDETNVGEDNAADVDPDTEAGFLETESTINDADIVTASAIASFSALVGSVVGFYGHWDGIGDTAIEFTEEMFTEGKGPPPQQVFADKVKTHMEHEKLKMRKVLKPTVQVKGETFQTVQIFFTNDVPVDIKAVQLDVSGEGLIVCQALDYDNDVDGMQTCNEVEGAPLQLSWPDLVRDQRPTTKTIGPGETKTFTVLLKQFELLSPSLTARAEAVTVEVTSKAGKTYQKSTVLDGYHGDLQL